MYAVELVERVIVKTFGLLQLVNSIFDSACGNFKGNNRLHQEAKKESQIELEGDVLMITSGTNASKNECPMKYT